LAYEPRLFIQHLVQFVNVVGQLAPIIAAKLLALAHAVLDAISFEEPNELVVRQHGLHHCPRLHRHVFIVCATYLYVVCAHSFLLTFFDKGVLFIVVVKAVVYVIVVDPNQMR